MLARSTKPWVRKKPLLPGTKRMKSKHRACGPPTKAQQAHQDLQREHGCAMCLLLGLAKNACGPVRVHHRTIGDKHGQLQLGQDDTVGLGDWHHQGILMEDRASFHLRFLSRDAMRDKYGPSLAHHKRAFVELIAEKLGERSTAALQKWQDDQLPDATP